MTAAADLNQAATLAPKNLQIPWAADTLKTKLSAFWAALNPSFEDAIPNDHPIGNWIALIGNLAQNILPYEPAASGTTQVGTLATYQTAVTYVFRLCKLAYALQNSTNPKAKITSGQAAAILAAYNTQFA